MSLAETKTKLEYISNNSGMNQFAAKQLLQDVSTYESRGMTKMMFLTKVKETKSKHKGNSRSLEILNICDELIKNS